MTALLGTLFVIGLGAIVAGYFVRIRIFRSMELDHVAAPYLEDTQLLAFGDLLFIYLYRKRDEVAPQFKALVTTYFWVDLTGVVSLVAMFTLHWLAA